MLGSLPLLSFHIGGVEPSDNITRKFAFKVSDILLRGRGAGRSRSDGTSRHIARTLLRTVMARNVVKWRHVGLFMRETLVMCCCSDSSPHPLLQDPPDSTLTSALLSSHRCHRCTLATQQNWPLAIIYSCAQSSATSLLVFCNSRCWIAVASADGAPLHETCISNSFAAIYCLPL